jgi:hypothetical protein
MMPVCASNGQPIKLRARARELLRRGVARGLAEQLQFTQLVGPLERMRYSCDFDWLVSVGLVERVLLDGCRWFYRLTAEGRTEAEKPVVRREKKPKPKGRPKRLKSKWART